MRIGIVGAGQLAQMMAQAAKQMNIETICLALSQEECAGRESALCVVPALKAAHVQTFVNDVDIITIETENIPLDFAKYLSSQKSFYPSVKALEISQDRLFEKQLFQQVGLSPAPFYAINTELDISAALEAVGLPGILKTRRLGYDGKGQIRCYSKEDLVAGVEALSPAALIYEGLVKFDREISLMGVRNIKGEILFYPLCENEHQGGILRITRAPLVNETLSLAAQHYMKKILKALNYVGVLTIEFFVKDNTLIGNEMAPRVHNSGHWTIEGAQTSQFENHLRAIAGLPLGACDAKGFSIMINYIGSVPEAAEMKCEPHIFYHIYGKTAKPGRKLGHVTVVGENEKEAVLRLSALCI